MKEKPLTRVLRAIREYDNYYAFFSSASGGNTGHRCMREAMMAVDEGRLRLAALLVSHATEFDIGGFARSPQFLALPKSRVRV